MTLAIFPSPVALALYLKPGRQANRWYNPGVENATIKTFFRALSYLLSPPMVFALLGFGVALVEAPGGRGLWLGLIYGFFVSLVPLSVPVYLVRSGQAADLHISEQRLRRVPYLVGTLSALLAWVLLRMIPAPVTLQSLALVTALGLGSLGALNQVSLVSSHAAAVSMAALFVGVAYGWAAALWCLPVVALVLLARYYLRRHTLAQLLSGVLVGVAPVLLLVALRVL